MDDYELISTMVDKDKSENRYSCLESIMKDLTHKVGLPYSYFIKIFENPMEGWIFPLEPYPQNWAIKELIKDDINYYKVVVEFEKHLCKLFDIEDQEEKKISKVITAETYNQLISLSLIMKKLTKFLLENKQKDMTAFSDSMLFLNQIKIDNLQIPEYLYPLLAVLFLYENMKRKFLHAQSSKRMTNEQIQAIKDRKDIFTKYYWEVFAQIQREIGIIKQKPKIQSNMEIKSTDVFIYKNKSYSEPFFDSKGRARSIIFSSDKRCGKTIALLRNIESGLLQGYTIFMFGPDVRKELRYANFPMKNDKSTSEMWEILQKQNEQPKGLPIVVYCHDPEFPIEKDINNFNGTESEWENLNGVVLFDTYEINILQPILESLMQWRSKNKEKKIITFLNEMHEFVPVIASGEKWELLQIVKRFFTNIGGFKMPMVGNTQYISKIDSNARQTDTLFVSYLSNPKDRKAIADILNDKRIWHILGDQNLKRENLFYKFSEGKVAKVKFCVPRCLPEATENSLYELFEGIISKKQSNIKIQSL